jgi:hypothetical protein
MVLEHEGEELVDATEIAGRLGLRGARQVLDLRVHRLGFPDPVGRRGRTLVWCWSDVDRWTVVGLDDLAPTFFAAHIAV